MRASRVSSLVHLKSPVNDNNTGKNYEPASGPGGPAGIWGIGPPPMLAELGLVFGFNFPS